MANFNDQWIEIFAAGSHNDSKGGAHKIDSAFLDSAVANFNAAEHQPPIVIGHPCDNSPAFGWTRELRRNGDKLEARFSDVDPGFESMVRDGKFRKRSASFYVDAPTAPGGHAPALRHIGFLGAQPPAVKGLRDISFAEGEAITFDFSEGDNTMDDKTETTLVTKILEGIKSLLPKRDDDPSKALASASFSEVDVKKLVKDAVTAATANFSEKLTRLESENETLRKSVDSQGAKTTRAEIVSFVEKLGLEKCPPAFRKAGVVEFMETLAAMPTEQKVIVIEFSETDGKEVQSRTETPALDWFKNFMQSLPSFVSFGEKFGAIDHGDASASVVSPERTEELRQKAGLPTK